jgi:hypothetical protein
VILLFMLVTLARDCYCQKQQANQYSRPVC